MDASSHVKRISSMQSRFFNVGASIPSILYKPNTLIPLAHTNTISSARSLFWINSALLSKQIDLPNKRFDPFRVGFSLYLCSNPSFSTMGGSSSEGHTSVHDFTVKDIRGNDVDLSIYKGKALLIVNVASECGLTTSNYKEMNDLYAKYKDQGLEILAFPCNQFNGQEPGNNEQIAEVACTRFKAEFPIFDKVDVNGGNAAPIYKFLKPSKGGLLGDSIKWNFTKFLVDKDGNVVDRYAPTTSPLSIEKDIKKLLGIA